MLFGQSAENRFRSKRRKNISELMIWLSNDHSPQIRQNGELLARMCRGESHFSQRWQMSSVSECIESGEMVGECWANVSSPGKVGRPREAADANQRSCFLFNSCE